MADLLKAAKDPKFREDVIRGLGETFSRGVAGIVGAPVDIATMAMRPFGYNVPAEQVVGGSEYIGKQMEEAGLISSARRPAAEFLANVVTPDPMDAAKLGAMFIGPIAKAWDADAAARAAKMEAEGFDPRTIWSETGTWRGPDNKWRQEISDADALFNTSILNGKRVENPILTGHGNMDMGPTVGENAMLYHPELQNAYGRDLTKSTLIGSKNTMLGDGPQGAFDPTTSTLTLYAPATAETARSTALHELQHAIQQREGFARGGASSEFAGIDLASQSELDRVNAILNSGEYDMRDYDKLLQKKRDILNSAKSSLSPYEAYRRLAGEAEARATQARMGMTAAERRAKFPEESYDVPMSELIIREQSPGRAMSMRQAPRDEAMRIAQANAAKPISEGGLGLPPDNTAMDRAKAMGFDVETPLYHGTTKNIEKFLADRPIEKDQGWYGKGIYTTPDPDTASAYANWNENAPGQNVIQMYARKGNVFDYGEGEPIKTPQESEQFTKTLRDLGYQSVEVPNKFADPRFEKNYETVLLDPSQLRSSFAAFDPAKRYESDLLGAADPRLLAGAAGATGAGLYGASRMQESEERPQPRFGFRPDGTPKGEGWLGVLPLSDGNVATEYSMQSQAVKVGDQMVDFPTLVPTLNQEEVNLMLSDIIPNRKPIPEPIVQKAIKHAKQRLDKGLSPFKELGE